MPLPAFEPAWRGHQRIEPRICVLEVRDKAKPEGEPIALLFVERQEDYEHDPKTGKVWKASIRLSFQTIEAKHSGRSPAGEFFSGSYTQGFGETEASVSLVGGALFLDPSHLRGQRIGTCLMNKIVSWAQQWPDASVSPIKLVSGQAYEENKGRRNRFYERFGLEFDYSDPLHREGVSKPMRVNALKAVESWKENVLERDVRDLLGDVLYDHSNLEMALSAQKSTIKQLSEALRDAEDRPVRWAAYRLWRLAGPSVAVVAMLAAAAACVWLAVRA